MSEAQDYPLGYSNEEAQRLADQAARLEELTEDVLRRAGLRPGMHVLDIGSGTGDVSLLIAKMVGCDGAVLGVEKAPSSVEIARARVEQLGISNVAFAESDLADFTTDKKFDAIVGRFVLQYVPERAVILQRLAGYLHPGGIVAFLEVDLAQMAQIPPSPLFTQARRWMLEAFAAGGAEVEMGAKLFATFLQAGLPAPDMIAAHPVVGGPTSSGYGDLAQGLRSLLPRIEQGRIADGAEIGIETLEGRLREDAAANDRVLFMSRVVGAWTRLVQETP